MQSSMIITWESTMGINENVGQQNAIEKFHYGDPEYHICSAYLFWTAMLTHKMLLTKDLGFSFFF